MKNVSTHEWTKRPVGAPRAKRQSWWARQEREIAQVRANFASPPGTFAWACLHGPTLCQRIREARPDLATWTREEIRENRRKE